MDFQTFMDYLKQYNITYNKLDTTTILGEPVIKVIPKGRNMKPRIFDRTSGEHLSPNLELTNIDFSQNLELSKLLKIVDDKIRNMSTKGVYHPRRLLPKWSSLKSNKQKLELFKKYMKAPTSSIGFLRLIEVNLPNKTLESVIIEHPHFESLIGIDGLKQKCIDKFMLYENGRLYLEQKGLNSEKPLN